MDNNQIKGAILVGAGTTLLGAVTVSYLKTVRTERKKRQAIKEWETESLTLIRTTKDELINYVMSDDYNPQEFWNRLIETNEFVTIAIQASRPNT